MQNACTTPTASAANADTAEQAYTSDGLPVLRVTGTYNAFGGDGVSWHFNPAEESLKLNEGSLATAQNPRGILRTLQELYHENPQVPGVLGARHILDNGEFAVTFKPNGENQGIVIFIKNPSGRWITRACIR